MNHTTSDEKIQGLRDALLNADPDNDDHWTQSGLPAMQYLEDATGQDWNRADVDAIAPAFSRESHGEYLKSLDEKDQINDSVDVGESKPDLESEGGLPVDTSDTPTMPPPAPDAEATPSEKNGQDVAEAGEASGTIRPYPGSYRYSEGHVRQAVRELIFFADNCRDELPAAIQLAVKNLKTLG